VSIVMVVRDGEAHLHEALESLRAQLLDDIEVLVVDDGSRDATPEILERQRARDSRLRLLPRGRSGPVAGLNEACHAARSEYVARLDADDVCSPSRLVDQLQYMASRPQVVLVGGAIEMIDSQGRRLGRFGYPTADDEIRRALRERNSFAHSATFFRREAFLRAGGYREGYSPAEDYDLWLRMSELGALANLNRVVVRYRLHSDQLSLRRLEDQALKSFAARISAQRRGRGEAELETGDVAIASALRATGLPETLLRECVLKHYLTWAETLALAGPERHAETEELLSRATDLALAPFERRMARARDHWIRAKRAFADHRPAAGLGELTLSLAADPRLAAKRLWRRLGIPPSPGAAEAATEAP
jgi:GT2 family glycosyltransferase